VKHGHRIQEHKKGNCENSHSEPLLPEVVQAQGEIGTGERNPAQVGLKEE
jgi:hypothetical protein